MLRAYRHAITAGDVSPVNVKRLALRRAADVTPFRRAIVTAAMAVLATSLEALQRDRECPAWPV